MHAWWFKLYQYSTGTGIVQYDISTKRQNVFLSELHQLLMFPAHLLIIGTIAKDPATDRKGLLLWSTPIPTILSTSSSSRELV